MRLFDWADGCRGHYCIGRQIGNTAFWEFYNKGSWLSAGQLFTSQSSAEFMMKQLEKKGRTKTHAKQGPRP